MAVNIAIPTLAHLAYDVLLRYCPFLAKPSPATVQAQSDSILQSAHCTIFNKTNIVRCPISTSIPGVLFIAEYRNFRYSMFLFHQEPPMLVVCERTALSAAHNLPTTTITVCISGVRAHGSIMHILILTQVNGMSTMEKVGNEISSVIN